MNLSWPNEIDTNFLIGILGLPLSIFGIYITYKFRTKIQLHYYQHASISLLSTLKNDNSDLKIYFKNNEIADNIVLYRASLINTGLTDIDKSISYSPVTFVAPENFRIMDFKIVGTSTNVNGVIHYTEKEALIEWDLLKKDEYLKFESILEYKSIAKNKFIDAGSRFRNNIKFNHRISNLREIKELKIEQRIPIWKKIILAIIIFIAISFFAWTFLKLLDPNYRVFYTSDSVPFEINRIESDKSDLVLYGKNITTTFIYPLSEKVILRPHVVKPQLGFDYYTLSISLLLIIFLFLKTVYDLFIDIKNSFLLKKINQY